MVFVLSQFYQAQKLPSTSPHEITFELQRHRTIFAGLELKLRFCIKYILLSLTMLNLVSLVFMCKI